MATSDSPLNVPNVTLTAAIPTVAAPSAPPVFTTTADSTSVTASVTNPNGATSYNIRVDGGVSQSGLTVTGLTTGQTYSVELQGVNSAGSSAWSAGVPTTPSQPSSGDLQYIFSDDFSSGDLTKTENGFTWGDGFRMNVSSDNPKTGTYSLRCQYLAATAERNYAYIERLFNLGDLYKHLTLEMDLYIPDGTEPWGGAAYKHRSTGATDNNKFLRIWGNQPKAGDGVNDYTAAYKVGASTRRTGTDDSHFHFTWSALNPDGSPEGQGWKGSAYYDFITDADHGKWMSLKLEYKMPTQHFAVRDNSDGYVKFWKNGVLYLDNPLNNYWDDPARHNAWQQGYLLGWANSGFDQETILFMDNIKFTGVPK